MKVRDAQTVRDGRLILKWMWFLLGAFVAASFCTGALFSFASWFGFIEHVRMSEGWTSFAYLIAGWSCAYAILSTRKR